MSRARAEREGDTESEAGSRLQAISTEPDMGLELMNHEIMTWTEVRCLTHWATQVHHPLILSYDLYVFDKIPDLLMNFIHVFQKIIQHLLLEINMNRWHKKIHKTEWNILIVP